MQHVKPVSIPLASHFKLCRKGCRHTNQEKEEMSSFPCSLAIGSLMYVMANTRPNITLLVNV
mgnify:CR=1 FL=1